MAKALLERLKLAGEDPFEARERRENPAAAAGPTIASLAEQFVEIREAKLSPKTATEYKRIVKAYLKKPPLDERPALAVTSGDLERRLGAIAAEAPLMANRVYQLLHAVCRWARRKGMLPVDPMDAVDRPNAEATRERVLKPAEIAALWKAAEDPTPADGRTLAAAQVAALVRLLLLLGTRST